MVGKCRTSKIYRETNVNFTLSKARQLIIPVILAGGSGTRLWPLSRTEYPKQFLCLDGELTMLQQTLMRASKISNQRPLVVCSQRHRFLVAEQSLAIGIEVDIILEPIAKNTAAAICLAALAANHRCDNEASILVAMPADHAIKDDDSFSLSIGKAAVYAEKDKIVTLGIKASFAHTQYGYIKKGKSVEQGVYRLEAFVEKPSQEIAENYIASQGYFWNSGIFIFSSGKILNEMASLCPELMHNCEIAWNKRENDLDFIRIDEGAFSLCTDESIDKAVMEKMSDGIVVAASFSWSDLGGFNALYDEGEKDQANNVVIGDVVQSNSRDNFIYSDHGLVATLGIEDLVIAQTQDALLVAKRSETADIKLLVEKLSSQQRDELNQHQKIYRPWGYYQLLEQGIGFKVKLLQIKPSASLSLQLHQRRAEHWIVVDGIASVQIKSEASELAANQSIYIPKQTKHRLANNTSNSLTIIEVQTGDYLQEDDIERLIDQYGREEYE